MSVVEQKAQPEDGLARALAVGVGLLLVGKSPGVRRQAALVAGRQIEAPELDAQAELAGNASSSYLALAREEPRFAATALEYKLRALSLRADGYARSRAFDQIGLARARFLMNEVDQACDDGETALDLARKVTTSARMRDRLREVLVDSEAHQNIPRVRDLRARITQAITDPKTP